MRLTTKGRYAVTAMLDIAIHGEHKPVSVHDIAVRQAISGAYLEQIIGRLKRAELLVSHRGPGGGYDLGFQPEQISVSAIVSAVGEGVDATRCGGKADCHEGHMCLTHNLWVDLSAQIDDFLQSISLATLVQKQLSRNEKGDELITAKLLG
jgi:Rrf2 family iron-sulfur cluster assembly transcriptional regulator|tara:strand:+ start:88 stop:540 length:453 start_codon:yes stop_codon:yes gene_type:complete